MLIWEYLLTKYNSVFLYLYFIHLLLVEFYFICGSWPYVWLAAGVRHIITGLFKSDFLNKLIWCFYWFKKIIIRYVLLYFFFLEKLMYCHDICISLNSNAVNFEHFIHNLLCSNNKKRHQDSKVSWVSETRRLKTHRRNDGTRVCLHDGLVYSC